MLRELLARGANIEATDSRGRTALSLAVYNGYEKIACMLLDAGANADAPFNSGGWTPLMFAARYRSLRLVRELIAHGADVEAARHDNGWSAAVIASKCTDPSDRDEIVRELVAAGAVVRDPGNGDRPEPLPPLPLAVRQAAAAAAAARAAATRAARLATAAVA